MPTTFALSIARSQFTDVEYGNGGKSLLNIEMAPGLASVLVKSVMVPIRAEILAKNPKITGVVLAAAETTAEKYHSHPGATSGVDPADAYLFEITAVPTAAYLDHMAAQRLASTPAAQPLGPISIVRGRDDAHPSMWHFVFEFSRTADGASMLEFHQYRVFSAMPQNLLGGVPDPAPAPGAEPEKSLRDDSGGGGSKRQQ
jgi:hypothetical protein